ncbi:hypothetical protein BFF78_42175 [Streptomyces fodineus]|uniref:Cytochrome P450 n=1 Tax=Streptomyces fodineus TaxID=1904616 RepID=A0A1D7YMH4_9ACTN|nr:hypothetical protein [Streptomyces fodineus]AOR36775.1 hypothetical protein BFF78_42175 [Streptomyces fodineus]
MLDAFEGKDQVDIVEAFSYPLPVTAICKVLGVPREDEPRFHGWADALASSLDPRPAATVRRRRSRRARTWART